MSFENPNFLRKYNVDKKPEAKQVAEKQARLASDKEIARDPDQRIKAYIDRLENIFLNQDSEVRARNIAVLKPKIYENTIIKDEDFPESHFEFQKQQLVDRGIDQDSVEHTFDGEARQQEIARVQEAQKKSLDAWIDHLASDDSHYPADIKFFAMQGILRTGSFDKDNYRFNKRIKSTTASFYQVDHEALSMVLGALEAVHHSGDESQYHPELLGFIKQNKDFGSMYAEAMRYLDTEAGKDEALAITDGKWRVFKQGSDPKELVDAFAGKRAYLCLGNIGDASGYLAQGDVEVYFSNNRAGEPVWPRVAIATKPDVGVYEIRGTHNANEDIDPEITQTDIIKNRLVTLPNGEVFAKQGADMKKMTELSKKCFRVDKKTKQKTYLNATLTKEELQFLYEINSPIEGFGYQRDPRIEELREQRNPHEDAPIVLDCTPGQIAWSEAGVNENTKAYIGPLFPGIFTKLAHLDHLYTKFPEGIIPHGRVGIGTISKKDIEGTLTQKKIVSSYVHDLLHNPDFTVAQQPEQIDLVRLTVEDLGFTSGATTEQIYAKADELGLDLCPAEVGPHLLLDENTEKQFGEHSFVGMKQITDSGGNPRVFQFHQYGSGPWLYASNAGPSSGWDADNAFVFRLRKKEGLS